ncbi:MAG: O-acetyl-ADP-ribose deacetylase [Spirochaetales bacterium]|nr:O-acetyl-ADP-ribose deacetylase [Spirochaetales bacterium]
MQQIKSFLNNRIEVCIGDITTLSIDAIVNAANSSLLGGGGVDGAIHRAAGPSLLEECRQLRSSHYPNGLSTGEAVITKAGNLPSKHVIHTVGPIYNPNDPAMPELLASCYTTSLTLAAEHKLTVVAFPAVSTGVYGYPKSKAANIASDAVIAFLKKNAFPQKVIFVFFKTKDADIFLDNAGFPQ